MGEVGQSISVQPEEELLIKTMFELLDEVERLRAEVRFLRTR